MSLIMTKIENASNLYDKKKYLNLRTTQKKHKHQSLFVIKVIN